MVTKETGLLFEPCNSFNKSLSFRLNIGLGFRKADDFAAILPLAALFQQLDALEAL
jgi:hypothetical protein